MCEKKKEEKKGVTGRVLGIDLGTTYSCVGLWVNSKVELFYNESGNRTTPSVVAFNDDEWLVGDPAKNQSIMNPENTVYDSKRMIGRKFSDEIVQKDMKSWPFKVVKGKDDNILIKVMFKGAEKEYTPEEISSMVLVKMRDISEHSLGYRVHKCCITVPAYFNDGQRLSTKDAGRLAELEVIRIINEPTAACMAYGFHRKRAEWTERNILIFDLGGGTFDVSVLCVDEGVFEVRATNGDTHLGGEDFDQRLTSYYIEEFVRKYPKQAEIKNDYRARKRLKSALERAKRSISTKSSSKVELDALYGGIDYSFVVTRARFEELCKDLFEKLVKPVQDVIMDAKFRKKHINDIVLVGGSTRIPAVQKVLENEFKKRHISKSINPDEAVAYGATVQGAIISGIDDQEVNRLLLLDVIPLSLGVETEGRYNEIVVPKNSSVPCKRTQYFQAAEDHQSVIRIKVYEGERPSTVDCHFLGQFEIGIKPCRSKDSKIKVDFDINSDGLLSVSARDCNAKSDVKGTTLSIKADQRTLTQEEVQKIVENAKDRITEDTEFRELVKERSELRTTLREATQYIDDKTNYDKIRPVSRAEEFKQYLYNFSIWIDHDVCKNVNEMKAKHKELNQKLHEIMANPVDKSYTNKEDTKKNDDVMDIDDSVAY
uniref:Chaperone HSP70 n=1 Tax=Lotharella vacuolata TaxID=74820 RepID=A0A0H5BQU6_9EUKA|nr:chaperone HSP70 [Lotharella vacuolata]